MPGDPTTPSTEETLSVYEVSGVVGENRSPDGPHIAETLHEYEDVDEHGLIDPTGDEVDGLGVFRVEITAYGDSYKSLYLRVHGFKREAAVGRWRWVADRLTAANIRDTFWEAQRA